MGRENSFAAVPVALYGSILIMPAIAYFFLVRALIRAPGQSPTLAEAIGSDLKGKLSIGIYAVAIPVALVLPWAAMGLYVAVAAIWIVPDRRFEQRPAG